MHHLYSVKKQNKRVTCNDKNLYVIHATHDKTNMLCCLEIKLKGLTKTYKVFGKHFLMWLESYDVLSIHLCDKKIYFIKLLFKTLSSFILQS